jgi:hypothetical protein
VKAPCSSSQAAVAATIDSAITQRDRAVIGQELSCARWRFMLRDAYRFFDVTEITRIRYCMPN